MSNPDSYIGLLDYDGTLVAAGAPNTPRATLNVVPLLIGCRSLAGTSAGGIRETQEMLDFCADYAIRPEIETIGADPAADGAARYRIVIDTKRLDHV